MLSTAVLIFREVLEAALIIGLVAVATREIAGRMYWIIAGVLTGVLGAILVAMSAEFINAAAAGIGQELLNAIILLAAVVMLGWHNIWMKTHGAQLAIQAREMGRAVSTGEQPLFVIAVLVGVAVLREGAEIVLFLYSMIASGISVSQIGVGGAMGLAAGSLAGAGLYFGLMKVPTRQLFRVTSIMLLLLSAGLAAQAAGYLVQADLLHILTATVWDTSWLLSERSVVGSVLHTLIGYIANPMGIQVLFYMTVILVISGLMVLVDKKQTVRLPSYK